MNTITLTEAQVFKAQMAENPDNKGSLILQENGEIRLSARHQAQGTPERVANHADISFPMGPALGSAAAIKDFVNSEPIRNLLSKVHEGHKVAWNGQNHGGSLTKSAHAAYIGAHNAFEDRMEQAAAADFKKSQGKGPDDGR